MKLILLLSSVFLLTASAEKCNNKKTADPGTYKAKLEVKALCMNYTLSLVEGNLDTSLIVANWTDESTGKSYKNVFGLGSPCSFPASIQQGDEFYFTIDTTQKSDCAVCMAYYPTPSKKLMIKVLEK
ncbi:hypothetical protein [Terrimonas pollutisoli]|uniref:hypothetical protein n=1 Tax=Terrimonas pollutisoli TaxID=3034147 RepID=UPI0023ED89FC|nr:hypothetical protein [Terrimonas sp. H1YJ31]